MIERTLPMTDEITALLESGDEAGARTRVAELRAQWEAKAKTGAVMNLSDLIASHEAFIVARANKP